MVCSLKMKRQAQKHSQTEWHAGKKLSPKDLSMQQILMND